MSVIKKRNVMTPIDLYKALQMYGGGQKEVTLCDLHHPCVDSHGCATPQSCRMINFDDVKDVYCACRGVSPCSSSDAVAVVESNRKFFFVEIKSWKKVIEPPIKSKTVTNTTIDNKAKQYAKKLQKKWDDSRMLCQEIVSDPSVFNSVAAALVFVTDIETRTDGVGSLLANINALAVPVCTMENYANQKMNENLQSVQQNVEVYYTSCYSIDADLIKFDLK